NDAVEPVRQAIAAGAITGMSFRFEVARDEWRDNAGVKIKAGELDDLLWSPGDRGPIKRTILEVDPLYELGPVAFPAYDARWVGVRSLRAQLGPDEYRTLLRELAAELRRSPGLTGRPDARSAGGGDSGTQPGHGERPPVSKSDLRHAHAVSRYLQWSRRNA